MRSYPRISECDGVYPPREDSYLLLESVNIGKGERLLDIGTGTGIIAIAAAMEGSLVTATDIDERAIDCARKNSERNGVEIEFVKTNLADGIEGEFDVITFNPPYLPPSDTDYGAISTALESEDGGAALIERFLSATERLLRKDGKAYFVVSSLTNRHFLENRADIEKVAEKKLFFEKLYVFVCNHQKGLYGDSNKGDE